VAKAKKPAQGSRRSPGKGRRANGTFAKGYQQNPEHAWKPGQSGNPGGRVKDDIFAQISRAVFEHNPDEVYEGIRRMFKKGSPKGLEVVGDRAYGKLTQKVEIPGIEGLADAIAKARKRVS
jgi:hypothetical protein